MSLILPALRYTPNHQWIRTEENNQIITLGITDYGQSMLGEIIVATLPTVGMELTTQQEFIVLESAKSAADLDSPIDGKVIASNDEVSAQPDLINKDPYGKGWLCKIQITDITSILDYMDAKEYEKFINI